MFLANSTVCTIINTLIILLVFNRFSILTLHTVFTAVVSKLPKNQIIKSISYRDFEWRLEKNEGSFIHNSQSQRRSVKNWSWLLLRLGQNLWKNSLMKLTHYLFLSSILWHRSLPRQDDQRNLLPGLLMKLKISSRPAGKRSVHGENLNWKFLSCIAS